MEFLKVPYPRERLLHYGAEALSNQELLAILFTNGFSSFQCHRTSWSDPQRV